MQWNDSSDDCVTTVSTTSRSGELASQAVTCSPSASRALAIVAEKVFTPLKVFFTFLLSPWRSMSSHSFYEPVGLVLEGDAILAAGTPGKTLIRAPISPEGAASTTSP